MSLISSVAPNGITGGPLANASPLAVLQAQAASAANPTAKLLPNAIAATTIVPSYNETPKAQSKPSGRLISNEPSSALAAQWMAQSPELSAEEIALFTRRMPRAETSTLSPPSPAATQANAPLPTQTPPVAMPATNNPSPEITKQVTNLATATVATPTEAKPQSSVEPVPPKRLTLFGARAAQGYQQVAAAAKERLIERAVEAIG